MAKPKRYRATKSPNKKIITRSNDIVPAFENIGTLGPASGAAPVIKAESKTGQIGAKDVSYIGREIFWIMVNAGIVTLLLIGAYFIFR
jgi:hypothetical protein